MDNVANVSQASTGGANSEPHGNLAASRQNAKGARRKSEAPAGAQGLLVRASRRALISGGPLAGLKPLHCRLTAALPMALGIAAHTVAARRPASRPMLPAVGGLNHGLVPTAHNAMRLTTSAPHANGRAVDSTWEIPHAAAEEVGMSAQRLERIAEVNQRYVDQGRLAGSLTAVLRYGKLVHQHACGSRSVADSAPLPMDALYRIHSMTKPITSVAAMQLYEQGRFQLSDPVARYIPELKEASVLKDGEAVPAENKVTMHHLLTHTAGMSYGADPRDALDRMYLEADLWKSKDLDEFAARLARLPLKHEPGTQWFYSAAADLTGLVVQRLSGQPLDRYFNEHIFQPLDMVDTSFAVPEEKADRFLPLHVRDRDTGKPRLLEADVAPEHVGGASAHDASAATHDYFDVSLFCGGAGLVSTLRDYTRFAEAMRAGGVLNGERILSPKTVGYMTTNHLPAVLKGGFRGDPLMGAGPPIRGTGFGLGYAVVVDPAAEGVMGSPGQYYWNGMAGTSCLIDPGEDMVIVNMVQLLNPWPSHSKDLRVAAYQAITDSKVRN